MKRAFLLLFFSTVLVFAGCASPPPPAHGRKLVLETIRHDFATTYLYREVDASTGR